MREDQQTRSSGPANTMGWRAAGAKPSSSSQLQRVYTQIDLSGLTTGVRKDFFVLVPQDSSFQRLLVSAASDTALTAPLTIKLVQASGTGLVDLSESHLVTRLTQQPTSLRANRAWTGQGAVYLAVTGTTQSVVLLATVELLTSEIP